MQRNCIVYFLGVQRKNILTLRLWLFWRLDKWLKKDFFTLFFKFYLPFGFLLIGPVCGMNCFRPFDPFIGMNESFSLFSCLFLLQSPLTQSSKFTFCLISFNLRHLLGSSPSQSSLIISLPSTSSSSMVKTLLPKK